MLYRKIRAKLYENKKIRLYYYKTVKRILNKNAFRDCSRDEKEIENSILEMQEYSVKQEKRLLVAGVLGLSPKTAFLAKVNTALPKGYKTFLLIENEVDRQRLKEIKWKGITTEEYQALTQFVAPALFLKNAYIPYEKVKVQSEDAGLIKEKPYLTEAFQNLQERHFDMEESFSEYLVLQSYRYLEQVLAVLQPDCVMLWNQFFAFHHILEGLCREKSIKCMYFEFGVLPGSYGVEPMGQMGESYPAQKALEFRNLEVSKEEIEKGWEIWEYIKNSRIGRLKGKDTKKTQQKKDIVNKVLAKKLIKGRPTIFYAGQNDYESGISPYTEHTARYHSPIFKSSDEAVCYLAKLAEKNDWNLIYKMHPYVSEFCLPSKLPSNVILLNDVDINDLIDVSDLTITILSQTGYVALFNEKPVLMLGYMQLKEKGCTYEAFQLEQVESEIKNALQSGLTEEQKENFAKHIAQLDKYYIFDNEWYQKDISYERGTKECAQLIENFMESEDGEK